MKKPSIPAIPFEADQSEHLHAMKQNIDILTGRVGGKITPLADAAVLADVINKVNEIIARLQS